MFKPDFSPYTEEGLRIVDEDGVSFFSEEENAALHQEMQDLHIDHASELGAERWFKEVQEPNDAVIGIVHFYGNPNS